MKFKFPYPQVLDVGCSHAHARKFAVCLCCGPPTGMEVDSCNRTREATQADPALEGASRPAELDTLPHHFAPHAQL